MQHRYPFPLHSSSSERSHSGKTRADTIQLNSLKVITEAGDDGRGEESFVCVSVCVCVDGGREERGDAAAAAGTEDDGAHTIEFTTDRPTTPCVAA